MKGSRQTDIGESCSIADRIRQPAPIEACYGILRDRLQSPCLLELIWSYWQEEGMLVQTMNAITRRFQNMRVAAAQRSAGQPRNRSAAAAQQPALGL